MNKRKFDIKKILVPTDAVPIIVIVFGLVIAITISEQAIRLIGASITILGVVVLFMQISQRMKNYVELKNRPAEPPPNFEISKKSDDRANRQVFEDFRDSFGDGTPNVAPPKQVSEQDEFDNLPTEITGDEGFAVIRKTDKSAPPKDKTPDEPQAKPAQKQQTAEKPKQEVEPEAETEIADFDDDFSSVRVIGPANKPKHSQADKPTVAAETATKAGKQSAKPAAPAAEAPAELFAEPAKETAKQPIAAEKAPETAAAPIPTENTAGYKEKKFEFHINMLIDEEETMGQEPRKEFQSFLSRVLTVIRSVTNTRTAAFLLANFEKNELILESYVSNIPDAVTGKRKIAIGGDVVSQIILNVKPEILTDIEPSAEMDLIPYYTRPVGISSFIGVPVFYNNTVIGIICADTDVADAYDAVTVGFFGHFTKLVGSLVHSYTEKYDLIQSTRTLDSINKFREMMNDPKMKNEDISQTIIAAASMICEYSSIGICSFDQQSGLWKIFAMHSRDKADEELIGKAVNPEKALIGTCIAEAETVFVSPLPEKVTRVTKNERPLRDGFFAAVPLKSHQHSYGALFVEGNSSQNINFNDIQALRALAEHAGLAIEQLFFNDILQSTALIDSNTGIANPPAFRRRFAEEMLRAKDLGLPVQLILFRIDKYASFDPNTYPERMQRVLQHVLEITKRHLKAYDVFGHYDHETLGVVLTAVDSQEARLWAERLRSDVAISVLQIDKSRFTVTMSIAVAGAVKSFDMEETERNCHKMLEISTKKTNCVTVFA